MQKIVRFIKNSQGSMIALTVFLIFIAVALLAVVIDRRGPSGRCH